MTKLEHLQMLATQCNGSDIKALYPFWRSNKELSRPASLRKVRCIHRTVSQKLAGHNFVLHHTFSRPTISHFWTKNHTQRKIIEKSPDTSLTHWKIIFSHQTNQILSEKFQKVTVYTELYHKNLRDTILYYTTPFWDRSYLTFDQRTIKKEKQLKELHNTP